METNTTIEQKPTAELARREHTRNGVRFCPNVDIVETDDELRILADMPGVEPQNIEVRFENGTLAIHGRTAPRQDDETNFLLDEYGIGDFHRTFEISERIDGARISAEMENGVLTLHLPKAETARSRRIEVNAG